jgi:cytosine/adenosine deaminase-related metal-dependent hydrolase
VIDGDSQLVLSANGDWSLMEAATTSNTSSPFGDAIVAPSLVDMHVHAWDAGGLAGYVCTQSLENTQATGPQPPGRSNGSI